MKGRFITLEGVEGSGKTTNLEFLCETLRQKEVPFISTREPGGTDLAEAIREAMLLDWKENISGLTEVLLVFAAREQHIVNVIKPNLDRGTWVVSDRFTDATYAYQGEARDVDWSIIEKLEHWVQKDLQPDLTFFLDLPAEESEARIADRKKDRMESENRAFFEKVRRGYLKRSQGNSRYRVLDASRSLAEVSADLKAQLSTFIDEVNI